MTDGDEFRNAPVNAAPARGLAVQELTRLELVIDDLKEGCSRWAIACWLTHYVAWSLITLILFALSLAVLLPMYQQNAHRPDAIRVLIAAAIFLVISIPILAKPGRRYAAYQQTIFELDQLLLELSQEDMTVETALSKLQQVVRKHWRRMPGPAPK